MSDDANYRRRISEVLNRHGFGWVVAQAEAQIAEGKPTSKQVSERELVPIHEDPLFTIRRPRSRRASLITSEPYTESERLEILLQGIEAAVVERSMIEQAVLEQTPDVSAIRFEPDSPVLIAYHQSEWECGVLPKSDDADALLHSFARTFGNYKAAF